MGRGRNSTAVAGASAPSRAADLRAEASFSAALGQGRGAARRYDDLMTSDGVLLERVTYENGHTAPAPVPHRGFDLHYDEKCSHEYPWTVSGDVRLPGEFSNDEATDRLVAAAQQEGLDVSPDSETSCMFVYTQSLADARRLVDLLVDRKLGQPGG